MSHSPINLSDFKGLYARGENENVPKDYLIEALNVDWDGDILKTRDGSELEFSVDDIVRVYEYRRVGESPIFLVLTEGGFLYDSTDFGTALLSIAAMIDFSAVTMFNRCFISPHNRVEGLPGEKVYIYDGSTLRAAAGARPTGTLVVSEGSAGKIEAGLHLYAVVFETASGYYTKPGPALYASLTGATAHQADLSGIPTGPTGTVARHIVATRTIVGYDGNQEAYSFYFVPGGAINDNTTTTKTVDFYESELLVLADHLFSQLEEIPACLGLAVYNGKLVTWNEDGNNSLVRVSRSGEPESFNATTGFLIVDPGESSGVSSCIEFRDSLYILKEARTYQTVDNGSSAGTWPLISVDRGAGTTVFGIGTILDSRGNNIEGFMVADKSGLMLFNGVYIKPELTYNIEDIWKRINEPYFNQIQVVIDSRNKKVYVSLPLDSATAPSHMLMGDFSRGLAASQMRWAYWSFATPQRSILVNVDNTTKKYTLSYALADDFYSINDTLTNDNNVAIPEPTVRTALLGTHGSGEINHFGPVHLRIKGSGSLKIFPVGLDDVVGSQLKVIVLSSTSGIEIPVPNAFVNERMSLKFSVTSINNWFRLIKVSLKAKVLYISGPA